jgi:hypothetical protein
MGRQKKRVLRVGPVLFEELRGDAAAIRDCVSVRAQPLASGSKFLWRVARWDGRANRCSSRPAGTTAVLDEWRECTA